MLYNLKRDIKRFICLATIAGRQSRTMHQITCAVLCAREEFLKIMKLSSIDISTVKIWFNWKVDISYASNVSSGFDDAYGWSFFDLNEMYDNHKNDTSTNIKGIWIAKKSN